MYKIARFQCKRWKMARSILSCPPVGRIFSGVLE